VINSVNLKKILKMDFSIKINMDNAVSDIKLALTAEVNDGPTKARAKASLQNHL
jgi:hypothetical protein